MILKRLFLSVVSLSLMGIFGGCSKDASQDPVVSSSSPRGSNLAQYILVAGGDDSANFIQEVIDQRDYWLAQGVDEAQIHCFLTPPHSSALLEDYQQFTQLRSKITFCKNLSLSALGGVFEGLGRNQPEFVYLYMSSHGGEDLLEQKSRQYSMVMNGEPFYPSKLSELLSWLDESTPKFVVLQGCHTGGFVPPVSRELQKHENLTLLTASHHSRSSFGCQPGARTTYYGKIFFEAIQAYKTKNLRQISWSSLYGEVERKIDFLESLLPVSPSLPQFYSSTPVRDTRQAQNEEELSCTERFEDENQMGFAQRGATHRGISPDGNFVVVAYPHGEVVIYNRINLSRASYFHQDAITSLAFDPTNKRLATSSRDGHAVVFNLERFQKEPIPLIHTDEVWKVEFSPSGRFLMSLSKDSRMMLMDYEQGELFEMEQKGEIYSAKLSPNEKTAFTVSRDKKMSLVDLQSGNVFRSEGEEKIYDAQYAPGGEKLLVWLGEKHLSLFSLKTRKEERLSFKSRVVDALFSSKGAVLIVSTEGYQVHVIEQGRRKKILHHTAPVSSVRVSEDENYLVTTDLDGGVQILHLPSQQLRLVPHQDFVLGSTFSKDSQRLMTWSADGVVLVTELQTGALVAKFEHQDWVSESQFIDGDKYVVTLNMKNQIRVDEIDRLAHEGGIHSTQTYLKPVQLRAGRGDSEFAVLFEEGVEFFTPQSFAPSDSFIQLP